MTFFVDANVLVYSAGVSRYQQPCLDLLRAVALGKADGRVSGALLGEVWHLELSGRAGDLSGLTKRAYTTFTPLLSITDETLALALTLDLPALGANDRIHAATCLENSIETMVSADAHFDAVSGLRRADPLDARALQALLGS